MTTKIATIKATEIQPVTPMSLIEKAQASGAGIEQMQQLLELQIRWEANEGKKAFNDAMASFREDCPTIQRNKKSHNSKYAGLAESIEAVKPLLAKAGLSHRWKTSQSESKISVTCIITHKLGHSEETTLEAGSDTSGSKNSIQAIGSTVSYLERYTFYAALGLASAEMDDDGGASGKETEVVTLTDQQLADIDALITETGTDVEKFCTFMQVCEIQEIPEEKFAFVIKQLETRRK